MSKKRSCPSSPTSDLESLDDYCKTYVTKLPFYVDVTSQTAFYTSFHAKVDGYDAVEEVKLGDTIAVAIEDMTNNTINHVSAFATQLCHSADRIGCYPFDRVWSPCEVVTIYQMLERDETKRLHRMIATKGNADKTITPTKSYNDEILMEVRWLYRVNEVRKSSVKSLSDTFNQETLESFSTSPNNQLLLDEVFESDHIDDCYTESFLGKVSLYTESSLPVEINKMYTEYPKYKVPTCPFQCKRFWSIHQKSFFACGALNSRAKRGRIYSLRFDDCVLEALRKVTNKETTNGGITKEKQQTFKDHLRKAASLFSLSDASSKARHDILCGREYEHSKIATFLREAISSTDGQPSIFIAGPPGTGKTATVTAVIRQLQTERSEGKIPDFEFLSINALELKHPAEAYCNIWSKLSGEQRSADVSRRLLDSFFSKKSVTETNNDRVTLYTKSLRRRARTLILLVDEIDYLVTKKQDVLYAIFDWPHRKDNIKLCVIGISNTINFSENILLPKVQSRLGEARVNFKAYNTDEVRAIIERKLREYTITSSLFDKNALDLTSRRVAAAKGDIRKAFQTCKRAIDIVLEDETIETSGKSSVSIDDIRLAARTMDSSMISLAIKTCTPFEALIMVCLSSVRQHTGRDKCSISDLVLKMKGVASTSGKSMYLPSPTFGETIDLLTRMTESRLIKMETPKSSTIQSIFAGNTMGMLWPLVTLNVDNIDVRVALKNTAHAEIVNKHIQGFGAL